MLVLERERDDARAVARRSQECMEQAHDAARVAVEAAERVVALAGAI